MASVWAQISYNFLFSTAGPAIRSQGSLIERAVTAPLALLDNQFHFNCHKPRFSCSRHQCGLCFSTPLPSVMPPCKAVGTEQLFGLKIIVLRRLQGDGPAEARRSQSC
jgi:hypothetical protein